MLSSLDFAQQLRLLLESSLFLPIIGSLVKAFRSDTCSYTRDQLFATETLEYNHIVSRNARIGAYRGVHVLHGRWSPPCNKIHCIIARLFFCVWTTRTRYEGLNKASHIWLHAWTTSLWLKTLCVNEAESQCAINDIADYRGWVDISKITSDPWTMEISLLQYWWTRCIIA